MPVGGHDETEDEEQDQQAVDRPLSGLPLGIRVRGHAGGGGDQHLPGAGDRVIDRGTGPEILTHLARGRPPRGLAQDLLEVGHQGFPVDILLRLAGPRLGLTDPLPSGRLVGAALKPRGLDKGLDQNRTVMILVLPVIGQLPGRKRNRPRHRTTQPEPKRRSQKENQVAAQIRAAP